MMNDNDLVLARARPTKVRLSHKHRHFHHNNALFRTRDFVDHELRTLLVKRYSSKIRNSLLCHRDSSSIDQTHS